jgi:hypothetical protein
MLIPRHFARKKVERVYLIIGALNSGIALRASVVSFFQR